MSVYLLIIAISAALVGCSYLIPFLLSKVCGFLERSAIGYCVKICLGVALVCGILYLIHLDSKFQINKEKLLCNKATDTCTYSVANYGNNEFKERDTFPISEIMSAKLKTYKKKQHSRRLPSSYYKTYYEIRVYDDYNDYYNYPIAHNDYDEARETLNRFRAFIYNEDETEYQDFKDYYIDELIIFFALLAAIISALVIYNDFQRWQKTSSPKAK